MIPEIQQLAHQALLAGELEQKQALSKQLGAEMDALTPTPLPRGEGLSGAPLSIESIDHPGYPQQLTFVEPHLVPKRGAGSDAGRIHLFHAIAHIEFSAINLALDAIYRFPEMPIDYHRDWLKVAQEEMAHFAMIRERLRELGSDYGALPVHDGLWAMARKTDADPLARMALVPRYLEARGLDVNPGMQKRLREAGDERGVEILEVILRDEIGHVGRGDYWFRHLCRERALPPEGTYRELVDQYAKQPWHGPFHCAARRQAGFSEDELRSLGCSGEE